METDRCWLLFVIFLFVKNAYVFLCFAEEIIEKQEVVFDCYFTENLEPKKQPTCDVITKELKKSKIQEKIECQFLSKATSHKRLFSIDEQTGVIYLTTSVDREAICSPSDDDCFVKVDVVNKQPVFRIFKVRLHILDINDNPPQFPTSSQQLEVSEAAEPGTSFILPDAADPDSGKNGLSGYRLVPQQQHFELLPLNVRSSLSVSGSQEQRILKFQDSQKMKTNSADRTKGDQLLQPGASHLRLGLKKQLDREIKDFYQFKVEAFDGGDPRRSSSMLINVTVLDSNDNSPAFDNLTYEVQVRENVPVNTTLIRLHAKDPDQGLNGLIRYHFTPDTLARYGDIYLLDETTGRLMTKAELDYETGHLMMLDVTASDQGVSVKHSSQAQVTIKLRDVNDNYPLIKINSQPHPPILQNPKNRNQPVTSVTKLNTNWRAGFSTTTPQQELFASKLDSHPHKNFTKFDSLPQVFENSDVGTFVAHVTVDDADSGQNGKFKCQLHDFLAYNRTRQLGRFQIFENINDQSKDFELKQMYQTEFKVVTSRKFDREVSDREKTVILCIDDGTPALSSTLLLDVKVLDRNDNSPLFLKQSYEATITEDVPVGTSLVRVAAIDSDEGPNGELVYSLASKNKSNAITFIEIDPYTGIVRTSNILELEWNHSKYELTVVATDGGNPSRSSTSRLTIHLRDIISEQVDFTQSLYRFNIKENSNEKAIVGKVEVKSFNVPPTRLVQYFLTTKLCQNNSSTDARNVIENFPFRVDVDSGSVWATESLDREENEFYTFQVVASLSRRTIERNQNLKLKGHLEQVPKIKVICCSIVEVVVEDENDNTPWFTFPTHGNDHVYFSLDEAPGIAITKLSAYDSDFIHNANLKFSIEEGNEDDLFELESSSGMLYLSRYIELPNNPKSVVPPDVLEFHRQLVVTVNDQGFPPLNSSSILVLVARMERPFTRNLVRPANNLQHSERSNLQLMYHLLASEDLAQTLAITLAVILVLISLLIAAICLIKNKQRRRDNGPYSDTNGNKSSHKGANCENDSREASSKLLLSNDAFNKQNPSKKANKNAGSFFGSLNKRKYEKAATIENHSSQSSDLALHWRPFYSLNIAQDACPKNNEETETLFHPIVNFNSTSISKFEFPTKVIDISSLDQDIHQQAFDPVSSKPCSVVSFVKNLYNDFIKASSPTSESNSDSGRGQSSSDDVMKVSLRHVTSGQTAGAVELKL